MASNKHGKPTAFAAHQHALPRANPKNPQPQRFFASCTRRNGAGYASDSLGAVQGLSFSGIGRPDRFTDARAFLLLGRCARLSIPLSFPYAMENEPAEIVPKSVTATISFSFFASEAAIL